VIYGTTPFPAYAGRVLGRVYRNQAGCTGVLYPPVAARIETPPPRNNVQTFQRSNVQPLPHPFAQIAVNLAEIDQPAARNLPFNFAHLLLNLFGERMG
jgi:hypothetical protein